MLTGVERQGTTAKNYWDDSLTSAAYCAKCVTGSIANDSGSGICINGSGLLSNELTCKDPYCLDAGCGAWSGSWQPIAVNEVTIANQIAAEVAAQIAKKIGEQKDPLEKNSAVDEVKIPPMSGFIEI